MNKIVKIPISISIHHNEKTIESIIEIDFDDIISSIMSNKNVRAEVIDYILGNVERNEAVKLIQRADRKYVFFGKTPRP